jgi:hypothetical protein
MVISDRKNHLLINLISFFQTFNDLKMYWIGIDISHKLCILKVFHHWFWSSAFHIFCSENFCNFSVIGFLVYGKFNKSTENPSRNAINHHIKNIMEAPGTWKNLNDTNVWCIQCIVKNMTCTIKLCIIWMKRWRRLVFLNNPT